MIMERAIVHIDMNTFFVSCERLLSPQAQNNGFSYRL